MAELVLGGQRSGKSARAEALALSWLSDSASNKAVFLATALAFDGEMTARIERHKVDRASRLPTMKTVEEPLAVAEALMQHSNEQTLVVIDCLALWLTNWLMPFRPIAADKNYFDQKSALLSAVSCCSGPIVLVSNEIGLGVIPMGTSVREYVDELGRLNQALAKTCTRVTLMVAGLPLTLKA